MVQKDKINLIYDMLIDGIELTMDNFMANGLSQEDLLELEYNKVLLKVKEKPYRLVSAEKFRQYGVELLIEKDIERARKCFEACYKISPTELKVCYHVLLTRMKDKEYEKAFEIFINLSKNKKSFMDTNFILYLLSFMFKLPDEYCKKVISFKQKDISLHDTPDARIENSCRINAFNHKFPPAIIAISKLCKKSTREYSPKFHLIRELLDMIDNCVEKFQEELLGLVKAKNYQEVVKVLEEKAQERQLSHKEQAVLLVAKEILRLTKERVILAPTSASKKISKKDKWLNMEEMLMAIKGNNFELALRECARYMEESNSKEENMVLYYLLRDWKELSFKVKNEVCILTENDVLVPLYELDYNKEDGDILDAYSIVRDGLKNNISLEDIIKSSGLFNRDTKLLIKLVYARYCYYNAMKCYDLAFELFTRFVRKLGIVK